MISFPNCKINLGLQILNKREDGYHNLQSVFYPVDWCDALEIQPAKDFSFHTAGIKVSAADADNLCVKAYRLLQEAFALPATEIFLLKNIPAGAGLGGGSADAAFTLKMLNELFDLKLSNAELEKYAFRLGSDCPFFINNQPCLATGKGEMLTPVDVNLSGYSMVIASPEKSIGTAWAYNELSAHRKQKSSETSSSSINMQQIIAQPVDTWSEYLLNDFEPIIFRHYPEIAGIKKQLYERGAVYASMSGSGSSVYGLFRKTPEIKEISSCKLFIATL